MREKRFHRSFKGVSWMCDSCSAQYSREAGNNSWSRKYVERNGYPMETTRSVKRERSRNATASCETVTTNVVLAGRQSMSTNWQAFLPPVTQWNFRAKKEAFRAKLFLEQVPIRRSFGRAKVSEILKPKTID